MRKKYIIGSMVCIATAAAVVVVSANGIFGDTTASGIATSSYEAVTVASEDEAKLVAVDKQNVMAANAQYAVIHNATILYANPNISLTGLGTAQPGQRYSVVNVSEGWVDVTTDSGQMAFIQRSDVTLESESAQAVPTPQPVAAQPVVQQTSSGRHLGKFRITHYCSCAACCGAYASVPAIGASGAALTAGASIAVDPAQIPYGTRVMINGNVYVAQDTGVGANCIDIFVGNDHAAAYASGMYYADVYVLD